MTNHWVRKLSGFAALSDPAVASLCEATVRSHSFGPGHDLIREGDPPGSVFVVLAGWVYRYKLLSDGDRQIIAFLMPGDCSNLNVGMLDQMDHSLQTASYAQVAAVPQAEIKRLVDEYPEVARAMYLAQLTDEAILRAWIVSMGRRSTLARAAHLICELYLRARLAGLNDGPDLYLPLSQIMLADALGMTSVHLNRVLRKLRDARAGQSSEREPDNPRLTCPDRRRRFRGELPASSDIDRRLALTVRLATAQRSSGLIMVKNRAA